MAQLDANNLQDRIDILYHVTNEFIERVPVAQISIEEESFLDEDGKECFRVHFGGGNMTQKEELQSKAILTDIVSRLANLKDPLKNALKLNGDDARLVESHINSSRELSIVVDLNNAEKHGYPLTKTRRSGIDPRIDNIRKELAVPLIPGKFSNMMTDGVVLFEADVVDIAGAKVLDLRELIETAITAWEDFCLINLAGDSVAITDKRARIAKQDNWEKNHQAQGVRVMQLLEDDASWHEIPGDAVIPNMIVKATGFQEKAATLLGFTLEIDEANDTAETVTIFDTVFGRRTKLGKKSNAWQLFVVDEKSDLKLVHDYYWDLFQRPTF